LSDSGPSPPAGHGRAPAAMSGGCLATRHACQLSGSQFAHLAVAGRPFSDTHCLILTAAKQPLVRASGDRPRRSALAWHLHSHPWHVLQWRHHQAPGAILPLRLRVQHGRHGGVVLPRASRAALADTIQHQAIQVGVQVGHRHRSRNQDDRGAVGLAGLEPGPLNLKPGQHPLRDLQNRREQRGLRRRPPPNLDRQRSLACWHMRSDVVDQV